MSNSNSSQEESDKKRNHVSWIDSWQERDKSSNSVDNEESKEPKEIISSIGSEKSEDSDSSLKKERMTDCYSQKELVEIDSYLMHAGKPWRKGCNTAESKSSSPPIVHFPPSEVKKWASDDLNRTIFWLEGQEEMLEPGEIKEIASEGIKICLQDVIYFLENDQDIRRIADQWHVVPKALDEMIKLVDAGKISDAFSKGDLCKQFEECQRIYEVELYKANKNNVCYLKKMGLKIETADYGSDETVEVTEEEIDLAFKKLVLSLQ